MSGDEAQPEPTSVQPKTVDAPEPEPAGPSRWRLRVAATVRVLSAVTSVLLLGALVVGIALGRGPMLAEASALKQAPVRVSIEWPLLAPTSSPAKPGQPAIRQAGLSTVPATWLDTGSQSKLLRLAYDSLADLAEKPFDAASIERTQKAMMETGWFARPCQVLRQPDGRVVIRGDWREPAAAVRFGDHDYLVSAKGERLPPEYPPEGSGLKVLIGPELEAPGVGELWLGGDVQAGLALLECLRKTPASQRRDVLDQVHAIDVSEFSMKKRLIIVTDTGSRIMWGGEPGTFVPGQAPDAVKLDRLAWMIQSHGRIDAARDYLDISLATVY